MRSIAEEMDCMQEVCSLKIWDVFVSLMRSMKGEQIRIHRSPYSSTPQVSFSNLMVRCSLLSFPLPLSTAVLSWAEFFDLLLL